MRTWVLLGGVMLAVYGAMRWLSAVYFQYAEAPTWSIVTLAVGAVLVVVSFFIKEKQQT